MVRERKREETAGVTPGSGNTGRGGERPSAALGRRLLLPAARPKRRGAGPHARRKRMRAGCRGAFALLFAAAGILHFVYPDVYVSVVPGIFPEPRMLVLLTGVWALVGGVGLLERRTRRAAGWALIAFLLVVFPANVAMAMDPASVAGGDILPVLLWLRLPLQLALIAGVWWCALGRRAE